MEHPLPSEIMDDFWIRASSPIAPQRDLSRSGKWMLFTPVQDHDDVWKKIKEATEAGGLGCAAKAATARPNPNQVSPRVLLTCVYTYDFADLDDVRRVLAALRALGFNGRLSYKADADTLSGVYGSGAAIYVAQPGSLDFDDRRKRS